MHIKSCYELGTVLRVRWDRGACGASQFGIPTAGILLMDGHLLRMKKLIFYSYNSYMSFLMLKTGELSHALKHFNLIRIAFHFTYFTFITE